MYMNMYSIITHIIYHMYEIIIKNKQEQKPNVKTDEKNKRDNRIHMSHNRYQNDSHQI
jgi:hypothetical protein